MLGEKLRKKEKESWITIRYKVGLASSYREFCLAMIVIQKSHAGQYKSKDKVIHKKPI